MWRRRVWLDTNIERLPYQYVEDWPHTTLSVLQFLQEIPQNLV